MCRSEVEDTKEVRKLPFEIVRIVVNEFDTVSLLVFAEVANNMLGDTVEFPHPAGNKVGVFIHLVSGPLHNPASRKDRIAFEMQNDLTLHAELFETLKSEVDLTPISRETVKDDKSSVPWNPLEGHLDSLPHDLDRDKTTACPEKLDLIPHWSFFLLLLIQDFSKWQGMDPETGPIEAFFGRSLSSAR